MCAFVFMCLHTCVFDSDSTMGCGGVPFRRAVCGMGSSTVWNLNRTHGDLYEYIYASSPPFIVILLTKTKALRELETWPLFFPMN